MTVGVTAPPLGENPDLKSCPQLTLRQLGWLMYYSFLGSGTQTTGELGLTTCFQ